MIEIESKRNCKGCFQVEHRSKPQISKLVQEQLQLEINLVNDSLYQKRMDICLSCPSLSSETTCLHCGCYVEFRTKLSYKQCPHPNGPKW
ncbi:DUF6171 family protein [Metabacillus halosaccharovorans]|uniref:DUF6171 family protein n=1 Tax=Metabacillus halosaccharovorans TaxID=930124 RepID=UPI003D337AD6|nr:hypothetical protein [Metabacillus halosaccharovorans]